MFEEGVEVLFKAFEGKPFSHHGKYYTIPPEVPYRGYTLKEITLIPAPERLPVECWQPIQSGSARLRVYGEVWHQRRNRRRVGRRRRGRAAHARLPIRSKRGLQPKGEFVVDSLQIGKKLV